MCGTILELIDRASGKLVSFMLGRRTASIFDQIDLRPGAAAPEIIAFSQVANDLTAMLSDRAILRIKGIYFSRNGGIPRRLLPQNRAVILEEAGRAITGLLAKDASGSSSDSENLEESTAPLVQTAIDHCGGSERFAPPTAADYRKRLAQPQAKSMATLEVSSRSFRLTHASLSIAQRRLRVNRITKIGALSFCLLASACVKPVSTIDPDTPHMATVIPPSEEKRPTIPAVNTLLQGSHLSVLAANIDELAIQRSSALQELNADRANFDAALFLPYPRLQPSVAVPLRGGTTARVGLNLEQVVWDGGRNRSQIRSAEIKVKDSLLAVWEERNQAVYDGLSAYADAVKFQERSRISSTLLESLSDILDQATARAQSGVSDRGEVLRMEGAISEIRRELLSNTSELARAQSELRQRFDKPVSIDGREMAELARMCRRNWPDSPAPRIERIELRIAEARISESVTRARKLPKLMLEAGYGIDGTGLGSSTVGLRLDASDMLGLGRRSNVQAASARITAAERTYQIERRDLEQELAVLEQDYRGSLTELQQLMALKDNSRDTIELFEEQLASGSISVVDGVSFHREAAQIERSITDTQHAILVNCLQVSRLRGTLVAYKDDYYD